MISHVFELGKSYMDKNENWDEEHMYLVITGDSFEYLPSGSEFHERRMREDYPNRIEHGHVSVHRGKIESRDLIETIKREYPQIFIILNQLFL